MSGYVNANTTETVCVHFFYSDSALTVMCFCVVVSKKITQISNFNCANALGLYSDRFGVL